MESVNKSLSRFIIAVVGLTLALTACSTKTAVLGKQQVVDIVWRALEPNTSSHTQAAWEVVRVQSVTGQDIQDLFKGPPVPGSCVPGPTPPENAPLALDSAYWYVQMRPRQVTPRPQPTEQYSPTAPPDVPEPFVYEARFIVDARTGRIAARKLMCVIY